MGSSTIFRTLRWVPLVGPAVLLFSSSRPAKAEITEEGRSQLFRLPIAAWRYNGLSTPSGQDVSIGFAWRASMMANSSRDPYWQASVRRESIDRPSSQAPIEDECSVCHMPITRFEARLRGNTGEVFAHLPFDADKKGRPRGSRRRVVFGVPPNRKRSAWNPGKLQWRFRHQAARVWKLTSGIRSV